jgi:hypothetical protein
MSRNGSGQMNLPAGNPVMSGTIIDPVAFNSTMSDIANELTNSIPRDGQAPPTNNLPMGGFRHTNVANAQNRNEYATVAQVQDAAILTLSSVSGTDTITAIINPPITSYAAGQKFKGVMAGTNATTSPTLNINSIGAVSIVMPGGGAPAAGAIPANGAEFFHNGTNFVLMNPVIAAGTIGTTQLADASVTAGKLASGAAAGNLGNGGVTAAMLAAGAAVSNIGTGGIGAAQLGAGSAALAKLDQTGTAGNVLTAQGAGSAPQWSTPYRMGFGTAVATTSGTAVDFTGIPSWAKRITVMLDGVSTNGSSLVQVQCGASGSVVTTGYTSVATYAGSSNNAGYVTSTTGVATTSSLATATRSGQVVFSLLSPNVWVASGLTCDTNTPNVSYQTIGRVSLAATLDRIRITTVNGTDTFDAGSVNIMWEG